MKIQIVETPESYDSKDVYFMDGAKSIGFGYQGKNNGKICIVKCPKCSKENYVMLVSSGFCSWCGFNANTDR